MEDQGSLKGILNSIVNLYAHKVDYASSNKFERSTEVAYNTKYFPRLELSSIYNNSTQRKRKMINNIIDDKLNRIQSNEFIETKKSQFASIKSPYRIHIKQHMECVLFLHIKGT